MRKLSDTTGSISLISSSGQAGSFAAPSPGKAFYQDLINRANTVPITRIFKYYGLKLDAENKKIICPISSHKGGRENSASFWYYSHTNTFWCFGCKTGTTCCDLVAAMENISRAKAAYKILDLFMDDVDDGNLFDQENFSEKLEIMLDFSNMVRHFRQSNIDEKSSSFIENICSVYDAMSEKHALSNDALKLVVEQLKKEIHSYK